VRAQVPRQQLTQSGHAARALSPEADGFSLGGNRRSAALTLIHSVHNHTDDDGNDRTAHTTADQLTSDRC
jgi:hypothetical protein